ncbi:MAG: hypothetical protein ACOC5K_02590 [Chloroflexota bacterium]
MSSRWRRLEAAITDAIEGNRLGRPVSVRWIFHTDAGQHELDACLDEMAAVTGRWFGGTPSSDQRHNGRGAVVSLLRWEDGRSAVLTVSAGEPGSNRNAGGTLHVIGSRGTAFHEFHDWPAVEAE